MRGIDRLLWREYRELRWVVLAAAGILAAWPLAYACSGHALKARDAANTALAVYAIWGGILFGMRAAAGERGGRTAPFMNGLPVRSAVLGSVRLLATVAAVLLPVLVMAVLLLALGERGTSDESLVGRYDPRLWIGLAAAAAVHVALVIAVCGAGADTEPRAVARGLLGLSAGLLAVVLAVVLAGRTAAVVPFSSVVAPWCYLLPRSFSDLPPWSPLATMLGLAVLAAAFVYRYGAALDAARSTGGRPAGAWSRVWALVSKAMAARPLRPGAYLLWAISMVTGLLVLANNDHGREEVVMGAVLIAVLIAAVAALLVPIAVFVPDLDPRINTFWRSRPISPTCWFWATYGTALVAMIATIALLAAPWLVMAAAEAAVARGFSHHALWGWSWHFLPLGGWSINAPLRLFLACTMCAQIFSASVVATCLVRRPLPAGLLAIALVLAVTMGVSSLGKPTFFPVASLWTGSFSAVDMERSVIVLAASLVATIAAWWVAARDVAILR
jgi:hypothetical protein